MSNTREYFNQAELALAAYADLQPGIPNIDRLQIDGNGMSLTQSEDFARHWRVLDQYDGRMEETYTDEFGQEHTYLNPTGLSVTAFENVTTGEQVVAIRGTEPTDINDVLTDIVDTGFLGTAEKQSQYAALNAKVREWLDSGTLQSGFSVTGHSLGGFLATNLAIDYSTDVAHTYLYNAPGLTGVVFGVFQAIHNALSPDNPITLPDVLPISNIIATGDVVSSAGMYVSPPIMMGVETRSPLGAHSMVRVTDALAIYNLFSSIDAYATLPDLTPILNAASNQGNETLETIVYALSELLIDPIEVPTDDRDALYQAIQAIETEIFIDRNVSTPQLKPAYQNLTVESLPNLTQDQIVAQANSNISYRYALTNLNTFAITGRESLYDDHNQNGELEVYNPDTQTGALTEAYLQDRTYYLRAMMHRNEFDIENLTTTGDGVYFWDADAGGFASVSDPEIVVRQDWDDLVHYRFGGDGDERNGELDGKNRDDLIYGGGGNDTLNDNAGNDYLEGNTGVDKLDWGEGNDVLLGGTGDDARIHGHDLFSCAGDGLYFAGAGAGDAINDKEYWRDAA